MSKIITALVTGGNQGIGYEISRQLMATNGVHVLLASRDLASGKQALEQIVKQNSNAKGEVVQLDVTSDQSVTKLVNELKRRNTQIDVLINNAGYATKGSTINQTIARDTIGVNYFGVRRITEALLDSGLIPDNEGRIVIVSSQVGVLRTVEQRVQEFVNIDKLTVSRIDEIVTNFIADATNEDEVAKKGWPKSTYRTSKIAVNGYGRLLAKDLQSRHITVNMCCPGWCKTRMGGDHASRTAEEGAKVAVWLATAQIDGTGGFYFNNNKIEF